ncbi:serine/threonine protein kinase [Azospirillum lipoferum]|uniref:Serine/threonine protein kinase n=1 Tax=Azospirillum lipoferum (strain 4B) TaxID=862719 RepID=G7ZGJ4_AZOL4|nr:serine/threonine-protein kinase [Azospirillum lipoferum]CBS90926.1 Putative serine/threonine protein kinase [Azospirillum lipoferum 4B]
MSESIELPPGTRLREYRILQTLGRGGFGITYLAYDQNLDKRFAIKEFMPQGLAARMQSVGVTALSRSDSNLFDKFRKRFIKEAQFLARFDHPSIVRVYAYFEENGTAYMVMRFEEGITFESYLDNLQNRPDEAELLRLFGTALDGLAEMHRMGLLHRDISARNILVRPNGTMVLIDFGSVRDDLANQEAAEGASSAQTCTDGYSPPEVYTTQGVRAPATDIYGLGAVLYLAVTGRAPVSAHDRLHGVQEDGADPLPPAVKAARRGYRKSFLRAIDWALNLRTKDRPQNVDQWRAALFEKKTARFGTWIVIPTVVLILSLTAYVAKQNNTDSIQDWWGSILLLFKHDTSPPEPKPPSPPPEPKPQPEPPEKLSPCKEIDTLLKEGNPDKLLGMGITCYGAKTPQTALILFRAAAKRGNVLALRWLGKLYDPREDESSGIDQIGISNGYASYSCYTAAALKGDKQADLARRDLTQKYENNKECPI